MPEPVRLRPAQIDLLTERNSLVATLDVAIANAKAEAKRTGKEQFVLQSWAGTDGYVSCDKVELTQEPLIVGTVSATEVPMFTRLP